MKLKHYTWLKHICQMCPCVSIMSLSYLLFGNSCCINKNVLFSWFPSFKPTQKIIQKTFCSWSLVFTKYYHVLCVLSNFFVQKAFVALTIALWKYIHPRVLSRMITYDLSKLLKLFPNPWPMNMKLKIFVEMHLYLEDSDHNLFLKGVQHCKTHY